jgi:cobalt-precorrin 5A hydrolase
VSHHPLRIGVLAITAGGKKLAKQLVQQLDNAALIKSCGTIFTTIEKQWQLYDGFIFIMATGIAVRAIAPLLRDKSVDPCVIVMDEKGCHVISLLSGHIGGGNDLAKSVAELTGGSAVITTASDTLHLVALDLWAEKQHLIVEEKTQLTAASARLVNRGHLKVFSELTVDSLPAGLRQTDEKDTADIIVSSYITNTRLLAVFRPVNIVIGTGCNRGTPPEEFEEAISELLNDLHLSRLSIRNLASIDKKNDETGLLTFAANNNWAIDFFNSDTINTLNNIEISFAALKAVGAIGVAEPTALLSAGSNLLLSRKRKWKNITMAVAQVPFSLSAQVRGLSSI